MAISRSMSTKQPLPGAEAADAAAALVDLSGPVAAAKNRASRNLSIAKSKAETTVSDSQSRGVSTSSKDAPVPTKAAKNESRNVKTGKTAVAKKRSNPKRRGKKSPSSFRKNMIFDKQYTFPFKVYDILNYAEEEGYDDIVSFNDGGDQFVIHNCKEFQETILPMFFGHSKLRSFERQCSYWGFNRVSGTHLSPEGVTWSHPKILRDRRDLVKKLKRSESKTEYKITVARQMARLRGKEKIKKRHLLKAKKTKAVSRKKVRLPISPKPLKEGSPKDFSFYATKANPVLADDKGYELFSDDVVMALDSMRAVSPPVAPVLAHAPTLLTRMASLGSAARRVSDTSLTMINVEGHEFPYVPETASDEDRDIELFPAIDSEAVLVSVDETKRRSCFDLDPLQANPFHLVHPEDTTYDDDEVSLLSMQDVDQSFADLSDDFTARPFGSARFQGDKDVFASFLGDSLVRNKGHCEVESFFSASGDVSREVSMNGYGVLEYQRRSADADDGTAFAQV